MMMVHGESLHLIRLGPFDFSALPAIVTESLPSNSSSV